MTSAYPISAPVEFTNTAPGDRLFFNADEPTNLNMIQDFVTDSAGDLLYRAAGPAGPGATNVLTRLPIGSNGDVLTVVSGLPAWSPFSSGEGAFAASVFASTAIAPSDSWTTLTGTNVTWDDSSAPNTNPDAAFDVLTGVYTVPSTGVYDISASVAFQGNNTTGGAIFATAPTGTATRQADIYKTNGAPYEIAISTRQAESSNTNMTKCEITSRKAFLQAGDTIVLRVRHDASSSLTIEGSTTNKLTYFSAVRVR